MNVVITEVHLVIW